MPGPARRDHPRMYRGLFMPTMNKLVPPSSEADLKEPLSRWVPRRASAVKIALWYAILSTLWIAGSGWVLHHLVRDSALASLLEDIKGFFFVGVTAFLLGWTLDRQFRRIRLS